MRGGWAAATRRHRNKRRCNLCVKELHISFRQQCCRRFIIVASREILPHNAQKKLFFFLFVCFFLTNPRKDWAHAGVLTFGRTRRETGRRVTQPNLSKVLKCYWPQSCLLWTLYWRLPSTEFTCMTLIKNRKTINEGSTLKTSIWRNRTVEMTLNIMHSGREQGRHPATEDRAGKGQFRQIRRTFSPFWAASFWLWKEEHCAMNKHKCLGMRWLVRMMYRSKAMTQTITNLGPLTPWIIWL